MLERSSNDLVSRIFPGVLLDKPEPRPDLVDQAIQNMPLGDRYLSVVGSGDYDHRKSSSGSAVLIYESGVVAKVPLGVNAEAVASRAKRMQASLNNFFEVSPATLIIITKADGEDAKPVVLQKRIQGRPLCETQLSDLLRLRTLQDIRKIVSKMRGWYWEKGAYDLCGQRTSNSFLGRIVPFIPSLSDNIMIDEAGHAVLADNILDSVVKIDTPKRKYRDFLRKNLLHYVPLAIIYSLIMARKVYNYFKRGDGLEKATDQQIVARLNY